MSIIQTELYDALMSVKVPEDKARAAAEVAATVTTNYPKPGELVTKEYIEKRIAELEARIAELKGGMANLEGRMDSKMAELKVHLMQQNRESTRMIIGAIVAATGVIVAAITVLAFVS